MQTPSSGSPVPSSNDQEIDSSIHLEYIRHLAETRQDEGADQVEAYHRALFVNRYGQEQEHNRQQINTSEAKLRYLEPRLERLAERLNGVDAVIPVKQDGKEEVEPNPPWNMWDRFMFALAAVGILSLVVFGVLNISFNLIESGIISFAEHPYRAYFWAALLPVGALAVKVGWDFNPSTRVRFAYTWGCLLLGIVGVLLWMFTYASMYPALSLTAAEQLESIKLFEPAAPAETAPESSWSKVKWQDMTLVASQATAEIFLSALLGIYMTSIYQRHRPVRLAVNPAHEQWDAERRQLESTVETERTKLAAAQGKERKIESQLQVFLSFARAIYEKEIALNQRKSHRKQQMLAQIATDLRERLEEVEEEIEGNELIEDADKSTSESKPS